MASIHLKTDLFGSKEAFDKGNYGLAQRLTKEKCEAISEAMRLMIDSLSTKN